jgi:hypothetical protein
MDMLTSCGLNGTFSFSARQFPAGGQAETVLCCRGTDAAIWGLCMLSTRLCLIGLLVLVSVVQVFRPGLKLLGPALVSSFYYCLSSLVSRLD